MRVRHEPVKPPKYWEAQFKKLWDAILGELDFSTSELETLKVGIECLRRREQARALIDKEGLVVTSGTGTPHKHPAIEIEKTAHAGWIAAFRALSLRVDEEIIRPGRPGGRKRVSYA